MSILTCSVTMLCPSDEGHCPRREHTIYIEDHATTTTDDGEKDPRGHLRGIQASGRRVGRSGRGSVSRYPNDGRGRTKLKISKTRGK